MSKRIEHKVIDGVEYKWCSKCGEWKPISEFGKNKTRKDELHLQCKQCRKQYYQDNREEILEKNKQYNAEHKEEIIQYKAKYNAEHKEEKKQYDAERYATIEGYAYNIRKANRSEDRKKGRIGKDEDILPPLEYYIWALQQPDFYDGKQYSFNEMGLDRIYNDKPHSMANVVPCSTKNNLRRRKIPFEEFCELMRRENEELILN